MKILNLDDHPITYTKPPMNSPRVVVSAGKRATYQRCLTALLLTVFPIFLYLTPTVEIPKLDVKADAYFSEAMTKAAGSYAVCRFLNGAVSTIQESQIQVEPAGIGVTISAGQMLDPLNDMTERTSDILVTAIVSLGVQKIGYEASILLTPKLLIASFIAYIILLLIGGERTIKQRELILKAIILVIVARLALPIAALCSSEVQEMYFNPKIEEVDKQLKLISPQTVQLFELEVSESEGFVETVENGFNMIGKKFTDLKDAFQFMSSNVGNYITYLVELCYLYVGLFLMQVVVFPILIFWLSVKIINTLFEKTFSGHLKNKLVLEALGLSKQ